ncbi:MAG: hypothetical protein ABSG00_10315 [Terracidiphilus sp.]
MRIRRVAGMIVVAVTLMGGLCANAGNNKVKGGAVTTATSGGNYNFACVGPALELKLDSFSLPFSRSANAGAFGISSGAAKAATSALTIELPASKVYSTLYQEIIHGSHYSSCTLVETVDAPASAGGGAVKFTWTFSQVTPTAVTMNWRDPSLASAAEANLPAAEIKVTLTFTEVRFEDGSGNTSAAAADDWTATQ